MFSGKSLRVRLVSAFLLVSCFLLVVGGMSMFSQRMAALDYGHILDNNFASTVQLSDMQAAGKELVGVVMMTSMTHLTEAESKKIRDRFDDMVGKYMIADRQYNAITFVEGEQALYDAVGPAWTALTEQGEKAFTLLKSKEAGANEVLLAHLKGDFSAAVTKFDDKLIDLIFFQQKESEKWANKAKATTQFGFWFTGIGIAIGFCFSTILGMVLARRLGRQLESLLNRIQSGSETVALASNQVSTASEQLSAGTTQQAAAVQETASFLQEISSMVDRNAEHSNSSLDEAKESDRMGQQAKSAVDGMEKAIAEINKSSDQIESQVSNSNQRISEIVKVIAEIGNKTKVINDIVFQTKLLSFNASVEAARAGEHGKGFAVVAEEIGNLARMSGEAAHEIGSMLDQSRQTVESIVHETKSKLSDLMEVSKEKVATGLATSKQCNEVLESLVGNISRVSQRSKEIAAACNEQSQGIREINAAIAQLDQATQANASTAQSSSKASNALNNQVQDLENLMTELDGLINGVRKNGVKTQPKATPAQPPEASNVIPFPSRKAS